jgi:hypothetical protein
MEPRLFPDQPPRATPSQTGDMRAPEGSFFIDPAERPSQPYPDPLAEDEGGQGLFSLGRLARGWSIGRWHSGIVRVGIALVVMVGSAGGLYLIYDKGRQVALGGEVPLIRADPAATKVKPVNSGGMQDDTDDAVAYQPGGAAGANVENLLAEPEEPMAKPVPAPDAIAAPVPLAPSTTDTTAAAAAPSAPLAPVPSPAEVAASAAAMPPVIEAAPAPVAAAPVAAAETKPAAGGAFRVQVAATRDPVTARREWLRMQHAHAAQLGRLTATMVRANLGAKGVFYRVQAGPIADRAAALRLCGELRQFNIGCIIVKP